MRHPFHVARFSRRKHFRRAATRYDKLAANFLAMIQLASMRLCLRTYEAKACLMRVFAVAMIAERFDHAAIGRDAATAAADDTGQFVAQQD